MENSLALLKSGCESNASLRRSRGFCLRNSRVSVRNAMKKCAAAAESLTQSISAERREDEDDFDKVMEQIPMQKCESITVFSSRIIDSV